MKITKITASVHTEWENAKADILPIMEDGLALEDTDYFEYINGLEQDVAEKLDLLIEPSIKGGQGDVFVYDQSNGTAVVAVIDYEEYEEDEFYRIENSNSELEYKNDFENYLKAHINGTPLV